MKCWSALTYVLTLLAHNEETSVSARFGAFSHPALAAVSGTVDVLCTPFWLNYHDELLRFEKSEAASNMYICNTAEDENCES